MGKSGGGWELAPVGETSADIVGSHAVQDMCGFKCLRRDATALALVASSLSGACTRMSDTNGPNSRSAGPTRPLSRRLQSQSSAPVADRTARADGLTAHVAAARFETAAHAGVLPQAQRATPIAAQVHLAQTALTASMAQPVPATARAPLLLASAATDAEQGVSDLRLPAAWYAKPKEVVEIGGHLTTEHHGLIIRAAAAACLTTAAGLLVWLGTMSAPPTTPLAPRTEIQIPALASGLAPVRPAVTTPAAAPRPASAPVTQDQITTAQILAVAERFVATGDVLAARAMLQERAGSGEPRALFALAETYDPHMIASWSAGDVEPSVTYARFLYEAARRGGIAEAQTRIEALR